MKRPSRIAWANLIIGIALSIAGFIDTIPLLTFFGGINIMYFMADFFVESTNSEEEKKE